MGNVIDDAAPSPNKDKYAENETLKNDKNNNKYFGLQNYGNTCYTNSVLQALYHCTPFRNKVLEYAQEKGLKGHDSVFSSYSDSYSDKDTLLVCLAKLFLEISSHSKKMGTLGPKPFIRKIRTDAGIFQTPGQQDAHEFLIYLLNQISEDLEADRGPSSGRVGQKEPTFIHQIFEGTLVNETKCLCCENITSKDESFIDLSLDIEQNTSLSHCLKSFSKTETLGKQNKFSCDKCRSFQEAHKRMKIKTLPQVLTVHLKRFKYMEEKERFCKLGFRVVFPMNLRPSNTTEQTVDSEREYHLFAIIIHIGSGPTHGHYIAYVKISGQWVQFDDERVTAIKESDIQVIFGSPYPFQDQFNSTKTSYILFYSSHQ